MPKSANLLDLMTDEDRAKVVRSERKREKLTAEWMGIVELGYHYGWGAVRDLWEDKITLEQAHILVQGARKIHSSHIYDHAVAALAGNSSKKGSFEKTMKFYINDMKVQ